MFCVLQLSDPHLLADPHGRCRGRVALEALRHGWQQACAQLQRRGQRLGHAKADARVGSGDHSGFA